MSTCPVGALKAVCLTWVCSCQSQRVCGYSIALCRQIACYSYMTILQLVLGDAEVLIVGQTSIAVICSSYSEHMGLMPLTNGEEKTGSVPSSVQLTATQGPPVGSQKKIGTSKVSRCRRMKRVLSAPEMSNPEVHGAVSPLDWSAFEVLRNRSQLIRGKKPQQDCKDVQESKVPF